MARLTLPRLTFWRAVLLVVLTAGLYATILRFTVGLGGMTALDDQVPWGIWIGFDVMCGVALAAGGFTISAVVYVFNIERFRPVIRPSLLTAFLGYSLVIAALAFDLGRPYNVWHPLVMWNPRSVMFEVGWCVTLYTTVLALEFSPMVLERFRLERLHKIVKTLTVPLVILGVLLSTLHQSSLGSLYLIVPEKLHPLWYSPLLPLFFFTSAVALGCAMTIFESFLSLRAFRKSLEVDLLERLGVIAAVTLVVYFAIRVVDLGGRGALGLAFEPTYEGRLFLAEMLLGVVAPVVMLLTPAVRRDQLGLFLSALLVVLGFVLNRLNVSITGMDRASGVSYVPSGAEVAVTASIVATGFLLFALAVRYLDVFPREEMAAVARGRLPELPAPAALGRSLRGATGLSLFLGVAFVGGAAVLGYDGVRLRPLASAPAAEDASVAVPELATPLRVPAAVTIRRGATSPGAVVFSHATHVNARRPNCVACHSAPDRFRILQTSADPTPTAKMNACGRCHDGTRAVGIRDKQRCDACHARE
jgi:c(7)-type cytochrome triheme protein